MDSTSSCFTSSWFSGLARQGSTGSLVSAPCGIGWIFSCSCNLRWRISDDLTLCLVSHGSGWTAELLPLWSFNLSSFSLPVSHQLCTWASWHGRTVFQENKCRHCWAQSHWASPESRKGTFDSGWEQWQSHVASRQEGWERGRQPSLVKIYHDPPSGAGSKPAHAGWKHTEKSGWLWLVVCVLGGEAPPLRGWGSFRIRRRKGRRIGSLSIYRKPRKMIGFVRQASTPQQLYSIFKKIPVWGETAVTREGDVWRPQVRRYRRRQKT